MGFEVAFKQEGDFKPENFMQEIKLSEYYAVIERLKDNGKT